MSNALHDFAFLQPTTYSFISWKNNHVVVNNLNYYQYMQWKKKFEFQFFEEFLSQLFEELIKLLNVFGNTTTVFKWLLWDSELGWRIIMRCFSEWRTIPDKQEKIYLARLGFEPATFGLLVRCSTNWATGQVGSWSSNDGTNGLPAPNLTCSSVGRASDYR